MTETNESRITVAALYKFVRLENINDLRKSLVHFCQDHGIMGTLLLASEGINGTIAGTCTSIDAFKKFFQQDERFQDWEYKESFAREMPFYRLKVKLKKEIVTLGVPSVDPVREVGTYVMPEDWNQLIQDPEVVLIDVRNTYEVAIGTFKNALNPETESFRQFPEYVQRNLNPRKHKKIAMWCTGGIRCEKASSYMKQAGFEEVYHLKGGILSYLEKIPASESLWEGECFVFDQRTAVGTGLELSNFSTCYACRCPVSEEDRKSVHHQQGISCPRCYNHVSEERKKRFIERQRQCQLANAQGKRHFGVQKNKPKV